MPYLTPETLPESADCRALSIPASSDWLAIVSGALTELTLPWNWQQGGAVTVDEAIAAMQAMIDNYYNGCSPCIYQPGGARIIRINASGHLEQVGDAGDWEPTTGDYAYPPVPAREGGTPSDQICLAATNAENVLHQIYEQLADYFASELTPAEALTTLIAWLITTFSIGAGTILFALASLMLPVFALVWGALSYLTVDLWDANFTKAFICMLIDCATNTEGVVTFDWDCLEHALYAAAVTFEISETQLRLYAQINYIIWTLGGVDALNTAAATTAITEATCDDCNPPWCYRWATVDDLILDGFAPTVLDTQSKFLIGDFHFTFNRILFGWTSTEDTGDSALAIWRDIGFGTAIVFATPLAGAPNPAEYNDTPFTVDGIAFGLNADTAEGVVELTEPALEIAGTGAMPAWTHGTECIP